MVIKIQRQLLLSVIYWNLDEILKCTQHCQGIKGRGNNVQPRHNVEWRFIVFAIIDHLTIAD